MKIIFICDSAHSTARASSQWAHHKTDEIQKARSVCWSNRQPAVPSRVAHLERKEARRLCVLVRDKTLSGRAPSKHNMSPESSIKTKNLILLFLFCFYQNEIIRSVLADAAVHK